MIKNRHRLFLGVAIIIISFGFIIMIAELLKLNDYIFDIITTLTALLGAYFIWIEFKRSRDLEEAQFILDLNNEFNASESLTIAREIIKKGNDKKHIEYYKGDLETKAKVNYISDDDNKKLVSYFTFFETFIILLRRNVFDISVMDELFATRFFEATNHPIIQDMKIGIYKHTYMNLYELHQRWRNYRILNNKQDRKPLFCLSNYYDVVEGYEFRPLKKEQIDDVIKLQNKIIKKIENKNIFVGSKKDRFIDLFEDEKNYNLCIYKKDTNSLVGFCNLVLGKYASDEYFNHIEEINKDNSLYFRTIFLDDEARGHGIQKAAIKHFIKTSMYLKYKYVICTVHPQNKQSLKNFMSMDFKIRKTSQFPYGERHILIHEIPLDIRSRKKYI